MKKLFALVLAIIMIIGILPSFAFANDEYETLKTDDLEGYSFDEKFLVKVHNSFSSFGTGFSKTVISDKFAYSGEKSICQLGRYTNGGTIKALNLFDRELNTADTGKIFKISFYAYFDKDAGVYKEDASRTDSSERYKHLYSQEELKNSKGTTLSITMCGPDEDNYKYRQGAESPFTAKYFVPWNEWTQIVYYYQVRQAYLPTGSTEKLSDPYINAMRIGQSADFSINNGLADTFYIDDLTVDEVAATVNGGFVDNSVQIVTEYSDKCRDEYARTVMLEYDENNRLIGAFVGEKVSVGTNQLNVKQTVSDYIAKEKDSKVLCYVYGDNLSIISSKKEILRQPEGYGYITQEMAKIRAQEMIAQSKAEYKDALSYDERIDKENEYFLASDDSYVSSTSPSSKNGSGGTLTINENSCGVLKFDISDSQKKSTSHAYVYFYTDSVTTPGKAQIYTLDPNWDEKTVTYNNLPQVGEKVAELDIEYKDIVYYFDISSYINKAVTKDTNSLSFIIKTSDGNFKFIAKESTQRNYKPTIIFEGIGMKEGQKKVSSFDYSNYVIAMKKRDRGTKGEYIPTPTKIVDSIKDYKPVKNDLKVNKYGSPVTNEKYEATGYFYMKEIDGRWWFIDPEGYKQMHIGVGVVRPERNNERETAKFNEKYGTVENWANMVVDELAPYGFNGCGFVGDYKSMLDATEKTPLNQVGYDTFLQSYDSAYNDDIMKVFDPGFEKKADAMAKKMIDKYADNPHVVGWSFDNEPPANDDMLLSNLSLDPLDQNTIYNYHTAWEWFKMRHGENASISDITDADKADWVEFVYDRYLNVCVTAIRKYDTNHLIFGPKLDKPNQGSFRGVSKWVDVVCYDYYGNAWTGELAMIDRFYRWSGKPLINAEWYAKGADAVNDETGLTNFSGVGYQATTQAERGYYYQNFVLNMLESKAFVGWHWFRYVDNPGDNKLDEGADTNANKGLYTNFYEPWEELLSQMKMINNNLYSLADYFDN